MAILRVRRNGVSHFYHHDGLGSTTQLSDASQNVTDPYVYRAFGEEQAVTGTTPNPLRFVGNDNYYTDGKSGLVLVGETVVNPTIGRLLSGDMLRGQGNSYAYAMGFSKGVGGGIISESIPPVGKVVPLPMPPQPVKSCPQKAPKNSGDWCYDDDFSPKTHKDIGGYCFRQVVPKAGIPAQQCCYDKKSGDFIKADPDQVGMAIVPPHKLLKPCNGRGLVAAKAGGIL